MTLILKDIKSPKKDYGRIDDGTFPARIVQVVDFGVQPQTDFQTGEPTDPKPRLMINWEVPSETITLEDSEGNAVERPRWIGREYTISSFEQAGLMKLVNILKPDLESFAELLNIACMIQVGSTTGGNAKVVNVMPMPKGVPVDELQNETAIFDFDNPNRELFLSLPAWMQKKIKEALNYNGFADTWESGEEPAKTDDTDYGDDIPF